MKIMDHEVGWKGNQLRFRLFRLYDLVMKKETPSGNGKGYQSLQFLLAC